MRDKTILDILASEFPGLIDGETEVNGAELVEMLTNLMQERGK